MIWISRLSANTHYFPMIGLPLLLTGAGAGISFIVLTQRGIAGVPDADAGAASGLVNVFHQVGGCLGIAVMTTVFVSVTRHTTSAPATHVLAHGISTAMTGASPRPMSSRPSWTRWPTGPTPWPPEPSISCLPPGTVGSMELTDAMEFVRARKQGVLTTIRANGRPQLSNIMYVPGDGVTLHISVTDTRAKTANIRRDPRVSLYVLGDNFWQYVVIESQAELTQVAADPHDDTVDQLVAYYKAGNGEHPDWDEYRAAMVADKRLILTVHPERAYGLIAN
jgi:PPOX class probable F420-dependent enzyme